jgi:anti-sigma factor RsiW
MSYINRRASPLLDALIDRELDESTAEAVSSHVEGCQDCSRAFFLTARIKNSLGKLAALTGPGIESWVNAKRGRGRRVGLRR